MTSTQVVPEGATATCRTCGQPIMWCTRTEPGYLPRTGWRDPFPTDPQVCWRSIDYGHSPDEHGIVLPA